MNRRLYRSLCVSPIDSWIIVSANVVNRRLTGVKIVQSEGGGAYDKLALSLADYFRVGSATRVGSHLPTDPVKLHLLIYQLKDGKMAVSFTHPDRPGDAQIYQLYGAAWVAVEKNGQWTALDTGTGQLPRPGLTSGR